MKEKRGVLDRRGAQAATRGPHDPEWPGTSTPQPKEGRGRLSKVQRTNKMWMHTDKQNRCSSINTHVIFSELHNTHLSSQRPKIIKQKQTLDYSFLMDGSISGICIVDIATKENGARGQEGKSLSVSNSAFILSLAVRY